MALTNEKIKKKRKGKKSRRWTSTSTCVRTVHPAVECKVTSSYGKVRLQPGSQRCQSFCPANTIVRLSEWCQLTLNHTNIAATTCDRESKKLMENTQPKRSRHTSTSLLFKTLLTSLPSLCRCFIMLKYVLPQLPPC